MPKPLIGLTTTFTPRRSHPAIYATNRPYTEAILRAGGVPMLIPNDLSDGDLDLLLQRLDGVLFTGGYDLEPACYGHPPHAKVEKPDPERDRLEIHLAQKAVQSARPFLGICRGIQVINVALGGSLYEDLPEQLPGNLHLENHAKLRDFLAHTVAVHPTNRLAEILSPGDTWVNSLHHQGVRDVAPELRVTATAPDGLVEGLELPSFRFALAVQWHPEEMQQYAPMQAIFQAFVQACLVEARV